MFGFLFGKRKSSAPQDKENPYFPASVLLDGSRLTRNGQGTRKRFGIRMYDMALYLPAATPTPSGPSRCPARNSCASWRDAR